MPLINAFIDKLKFYIYQKYNISYLLHRIMDRFPRILNENLLGKIPVCQELGAKGSSNKTGINFMIFSV